MPQPVVVVDPFDLTPEQLKKKRKRVVHDAPGYHVWVHGPDKPGETGPMHKHTADQTFQCVQGEATYHFPDGSSARLTPGMMIVIPAGNLYSIEASGTEELLLTGSRAEASGRASLTAEDGVVSRQARLEGKPSLDASQLDGSK